MNYKRIKLADHQSANCSVKLYEDGSMVLQSYHTDVILFHAATGYLYCSGTFSQTTRKHITWFLREYFSRCSVSCQDMKKCAGDRLKYHVGINAFTPLTEKQDKFLHEYYGCALLPSMFD